MSKEVAKLNAQELANIEALASMELGTADGFSKVDLSNSTIPFLKLIQSISPEVKKSKSEFVEGAEEGVFLNSVVKTVYGDSVLVIPIYFDVNYLAWKPNRGGFAGRMSVAEAEKATISKEFGKWEDMDGNALVETFMYYFLLPDFLEDGMLAMAYSSSNLKVAKQFNTLVTRKYFPNTTKLARCFTQVYNMKSVAVSNDKGDWVQPSFKFDSFVTPEVMQIALDAFKSVGEIKVDFANADSGTKPYDVETESADF